ncbi:MAG: hypothetical protein ABTD50_13425 [Polyangiaceae bacterium]|jgi:hypothetical protein
MAEPSALDNRTLYRRTLITAGTMLGASVVFVGALTLVAWSFVGRSVLLDNETQPDAAVNAPAASMHPARSVVPAPNASSSTGKGPK